MRPRFDSWVGKIPWKREWLATPVFLPRKSHGQKILGAAVHGAAKNGTGLNDWCLFFIFLILFKCYYFVDISYPLFIQYIILTCAHTRWIWGWVSQDVAPKKNFLHFSPLITTLRTDQCLEGETNLCSLIRFLGLIPITFYLYILLK